MLSPDVLTSALQDLMPGHAETFLKFHPAFEQLIEHGSFRRTRGPFVEFVLVTNGPGSVTSIVTGEERINGGLTPAGHRGNEMCSTIVYAWDVPGQVFRDASDAGDLAQIIKDYPITGLSDFQNKLGRQLVMGNEPDMGTMFTLNGDATYNPRSLGARSGILEFAAPSAQVNTVHGIASNGVVGWYNQYGHIGSFAAEGKRKIRELFYACQAEGKGTDGAPDVLLADAETFNNYVESMDDQVLYTTRAEGDKGAGGAKDQRVGVPFFGAKMYRDESFDLTAFTTTNAQSGMLYALNTKALTLIRQGGNKETTPGDFSLRGPIRHTEYELYRWEYVSNMGLYTNKRRLHGAVSGGANA